MKSWPFYILFLFFFVNSSFSQGSIRVENLRYEIDSSKMTIYYDLQPINLKQQVDVRLKITLDGVDITPTRAISGDVGEHVTVVTRREIMWYYMVSGFTRSQLETNGLKVNIYLSNLREGNPRRNNDAFIASNLAPIALDKNQFDINLNGTFSNEEEYFNFQYTPEERFQKLNYTSNTSHALIQLMYGLSRQKNFNIGLDAQYGTSNFSDESINTQNQFLAGPRIRWRPFGGFGNGLDITLENAALFDLSSENNNQSFASINNHIIISKYYRQLALLFNQAVLIQPKLEGVDLKQPITTVSSLLLAYFPKRNFALFTSGAYRQYLGSIPWTDEEGYFQRGASLDWGIGLQLTFLTSYALYGQYSLNLYEELGAGHNSAQVGLRMLLN